MVFSFLMSLFSREKMSGGSIIFKDIKAVFVVATSWSTTEPSTSHEPGEAEGRVCLGHKHIDLHARGARGKVVIETDETPHKNNTFTCFENLPVRTLRN